MKQRKRAARFGPLVRFKITYPGYAHMPVRNRRFREVVRLGDTPYPVTFVNCWFMGPAQRKKVAPVPKDEGDRVPSSLLTFANSWRNS